MTAQIEIRAKNFGAEVKFLREIKSKLDENVRVCFKLCGGDNFPH